jgi:hypothetical protein
VSEHRGPTVKAWLEGDPFDLQDLADLFAGGDVRVVRDDGEDAYYLTAPEIDNPPEPGSTNQSAEVIIKRLNGLARTHMGDFRPVRLSGKYTDPAGKHVFVASFALELRARLSATAVVVGSDGQPLSDPPSPWPARLALARVDPDVSQVLDIMGRNESLSWDQLYKVHEIIRVAVKPDSITGYGWVDDATDSAFRASANRADVSGDDARHARNSGVPPTRTMSLGEARSFIGDLVTKWLNHLTGSTSI